MRNSRSRADRAIRPLRLAAFGATAAAIALAVPVAATADDWRQALPGFEQFRKDPRITAEQERARRERARNDLVARVGVELESSAPLLGERTLYAMQRAVERYQAIVAHGGWPTIPDGTLRPGDAGDRVSLLRRRLAASGDLRVGSGRAWEYDAPLSEAVARFQVRHGLRVTGFVDRRTLVALNIPADVRLRQLQVNLERMRELAETARAAERYVIVNAASYELEAVENEMLALRSNVVVGKPGRETPAVSARIIELNFYPFWRVPDSIASKDLIPQIRKDPGYFDRENFSVLPTWGAKPMNASLIDWHSPDVYNYKFRQDPGPFNALGVVRINMPNVHTVYLHDTPLKQLFGQSSRAFSSGCVRVERVLELAAWLLKDDPDWSLDRVQSTVHEGLPLDVKLKKHVPVHFAYVTAWAVGDGEAVFRPDIYGRDGASESLDDDDGPVVTAASITP